MEDKFEKLNKSNYLQWSMRMRRLLEAADCLDAIGFNTNVLTDEQRIENEKCKSLLYLSVDKDNLEVMEECTTATEIWNKLKKIHTEFHGYHAIILLKEFVHLEMDQNEKILEYVNRREDLYKKVQDAGFNFESKVLMGLVLIGLSMEYESLRKTIKIDDDGLTLASLEMRLAEEERRLKDSDTRSDALSEMEIGTNSDETPRNPNSDQIKKEVAEIQFAFEDLHHEIHIKEEIFIVENEEDRMGTSEGSGNVFTCGTCGRKFPRKGDFKKHLLIHSREKSFSCQTCDYKCELKSQLKRHSKTHTGETMFACEECDFKGTNKRRFQVHLKIHTGIKPFLCEFCAYGTLRKEDFKKHLRIHTGEKPYSCDTCDYKCAQKGTMTTHVRIHQTEKRHLCQFCDYKCHGKSRLTTHIRTHTGERPFACGVCHFKSAQKSDLNAHLKVHTGEKPLSCKICQFKCADSSNLKSHIKTHTGEKPFGCAICDFRCLQKSSLQRHLKTHNRK